jgi:methyl-accepting chemotaxis protein
MKNRFPLWLKLFLAFSVIALVGLIGNLVSVIGIYSLDKDIALLTGGAIIRLESLSEIRRAASDANFAQARWKDAFLTPELYEAQFEAMNKAVVRAEKAFESFDKLPQTEEGQRDYDALKDSVNALKRVDAGIIECVRTYQGKPDAARMVAQYSVNAGRPELLARVEKMLDVVRIATDERRQGVAEDAVNDVRMVMRTVTIAIILALIVSVAFSILFPRAIMRVVRKISGLLRNKVDIITVHTNELVKGTHALAAGANQQAASVEEIAASLEEISSMVRENADNTKTAHALVLAAGEAVDATQKLMARSLQANVDISAASKETSGIIKTIDEIAFQTNLLSLNAAVEAARAGEIGAGFAVVADEVRRLSMRSAEASKRTEELIQETISKVNEGEGIFKETGESIEDVVNQTQKIQQLVNEVASASVEQAKGLEQINKGVAEMEKVIQQNAAQSDESAASTQELLANAEEIMESVSMLESYIFGKDKAA